MVADPLAEQTAKQSKDDGDGRAVLMVRGRRIGCNTGGGPGTRSDGGAGNCRECLPRELDTRNFSPVERVSMNHRKKKMVRTASQWSVCASAETKPQLMP